MPPTKTFKCGCCKDNINETQGSILCKTCSLWFHTSCIKLSESALSAPKENNLLSFSCKTCNENPRAGLECLLRKNICDLNVKIDGFINKVSDEQNSIRKTMEDTVASFKSEIASCIKDMKSEIIDCNKLIQYVDSSASKKITALEEENNILHKRFNRADIVINGLPAGMGDLVAVGVKIGSIHDVQISENDIYHVCYFNNRKAILIKFNRVSLRDKIMKQYLSSRSLTVRDVIGGDIASRVYLNDHYSPAAAKLNAICRKLLNRKIIKAKITRSGGDEVVLDCAGCSELLV
ncbi:hypothetical protein FF38_05451 [Lucilia cuprina]|uniref:PHD-type domain-containing protein n=1 Tax=Lucilia cuprina TaxID=7375 RepID=A0A0L0CCD6_LUCCU|nr:hypothetical protein FF38_05451 [Lucilia cuprina]